MIYSQIQFSNKIICLKNTNFFENILVLSYCSGNPCVNGECWENNSTYMCVCSPGWAGVNCDTGECVGEEHTNINLITITQCLLVFSLRVTNNGLDHLLALRLLQTMKYEKGNAFTDLCLLTWGREGIQEPHDPNHNRKLDHTPPQDSVTIHFLPSLQPSFPTPHFPLSGHDDYTIPLSHKKYGMLNKKVTGTLD